MTRRRVRHCEQRFTPADLPLPPKRQTGYSANPAPAREEAVRVSLVTLLPNTAPEPLERALRGLGLWTTRQADAQGQVRALAVLPHSLPVAVERLNALPGVAEVLSAPSPHPRVDAQAGQPIALGAITLGEAPLLVAGPCSAESQAQVFASAKMAAYAGARMLRGGAFKPRTSPYEFSGVGREALGWLKAAADAFGLGLVTEVMAEGDVEAVAEVADLLQVGSRNMQNFALLKAVGRAGRPVLLKRGMAARVDEWLLSGEHLLAAGASSVVFCERGLSSFDPQTRNLLDLGAVALLKHVHHQPVVVDPSHAVGRRDLLPALARAALAAGADGVMVEAHPEPAQAKSDGPQALDQDGLSEVARALGLGDA